MVVSFMLATLMVLTMRMVFYVGASAETPIEGLSLGLLTMIVSRH